jgi:hypothetical protein
MSEVRISVGRAAVLKRVITVSSASPGKLDDDASNLAVTSSFYEGCPKSI